MEMHLEKQLDVVHLIKSLVAFDRYVKVKTSSLERHYLRKSHEALFMASEDD